MPSVRTFTPDMLRLHAKPGGSAEQPATTEKITEYPFWEEVKATLL